MRKLFVLLFGGSIKGFSQIILLVFLLVSCKKEKVNHEMKHLSKFDQGELSSARLVNTVEYAQVLLGGEKLTNFISRRLPSILDPYVVPGSSFYSMRYPGTDYFPIDGYLGREWRIPKRLFTDRKKLDLFLIDGAGYGVVPKLGLTVENSKESIDYYLGWYGSDSLYYKVRRSEKPASNPHNFKIRIINLSVPVPSQGNGSGVFRDLTGPMTLTYADGTPVSEFTSNIDYTSRSSPYIELPYGKYQFKIINSQGRLLPGMDGGIGELTLDPPTASIELDFMQPSHLHYAPIHSFKPGGNYSILIYPHRFRVITQKQPFVIDQLFQNAFRIIEDRTPPANLSFCRIQGVNAYSETELQFRINGKNLNNVLQFGIGSDYFIANVGATEIKILDKNDRVILSEKHHLRENQNYTAWVYPDLQQQIRMSLIANDLSGEEEIVDNGQDEQSNMARTEFMPFRKRFLNFSPDFPYVTFTKGLGQDLGRDQIHNLQPGISPLNFSFIQDSYMNQGFEIMAYRSGPGKVPGIWADDIITLNGENFIANRGLYTRVAEKLPVQEAGYYSVALIGRVGEDVPKGLKAKMVVLKHNK